MSSRSLTFAAAALLALSITTPAFAQEETPTRTTQPRDGRDTAGAEAECPPRHMCALRESFRSAEMQVS